MCVCVFKGRGHAIIRGFINIQNSWKDTQEPDKRCSLLKLGGGILGHRVEGKPSFQLHPFVNFEILNYIFPF